MPDLPPFEYECTCDPPPDADQYHSEFCVVGNTARAEMYAIEHETDRPLMALLPEAVLTPWSEIRRNHDQRGPVGVRHIEVDPGPEYGGGGHGWRIDAIEHRNRKGRLTGVLYRYGHDFRAIHPSFPPLGAVNMWVDPTRQRRGIGTALAVAAIRRWPDIDLQAQRYTAGGLAMARVAQAVRKAG